MYQDISWWKNIPQVLQARNQFMIASQKKEPLNANTGYLGRKDDPSQFLSFGDAQYFAEDKVALIGWCNRPDDPFAIIDLDNKPDRVYAPEDIALREQILEWALEKTYVEKSISGNGWHIVVEGKVPFDINQGTKHGIEVYANRGFVVLTGNCV